MKIIGIEKIDYTRKSDGVKVLGVKIYCGAEDPKVEGIKPEEVYISGKSEFYEESLCASVGDEIVIYYDKNGRIASLTVK